MKTELILKEAENFGIEVKTATDLTKGLPQIVAERDVFEKQYDDIIKLPIEEKSTWKLAKSLRLRIVSNRTKGINVWHKKAKDYFKKGGDFVDAIKRKEIAVNQRMEENLAQIEKYEQILEQKRIDELQAVRVELISPYIEDADKMNLGEMADDIWEAFYFMKKTKHEEAIEAERLAIEQMEAKKKETALHEARKAEIWTYWRFITEEESKLNLAKMENFAAFVSELQFRKEDYIAKQAKIKAENERLQKEAKEAQAKAEAEAAKREKRNKEMQPYIVFIRQYENMLNLPDSEYKQELAEIKKGAEDQWEYEREEEIKKQREVEEAKAKAEAAQKALKEKEEAEAQAKADAEAAKQAELNKGDAAKITDLVNDLLALKTKYTFKSDKNKKRYFQVGGLIEKIVTYILK